AGNTLPTRLGRILLRWQQPEHRRVRRRLSNGLLICLVLVFVGALLNPSVGITNLLAAYWPGHQAQPSFSASLSVTQVFAPVSNEIRCPVATAWSPDSSIVALLGYTQSCVQGQYVPAQINFYDGITARQMTHWSPDGVIIHALQSYPGVSPSMEDYLARKPDFATDRGTTPVIHYLQMLWAPNHSRLALSFVAVNYVFAYAGLFLANSDGSQAQVLLQPEHDGLAPNTSTPLLWDLQHGSVTTLAPLPPALAYTWNAHDQLLPDNPLGTHTDFSAYANSTPGNPVGERSFTIWQPGHITSPTSNVYAWSSKFATWSPDGRYFITNFTFTGLMEPPRQAFPATQALTALGVQDVPHIPAHDSVLLSSVTEHAQTVAWNPTGMVLAVYNQAGNVEIYDCYTGDLLLKFTTAPLISSTALLNWSPDGHSLVLTSSPGKLFTLWGAALTLVQ
ncbi:MAG: hypothetical protein ACRDHZ_19810, partial [Ktedonobacteraceae bacterium]